MRGQLLVDGLVTGQQSIGHDLSPKLVQLVDVQVLLLRGGADRQQLGVAWIFLESLLLHGINCALESTQIFLTWRWRRSSGHHIWTSRSTHVGASWTGHSLTGTSRLHRTWRWRTRVWRHRVRWISAGDHSRWHRWTALVGSVWRWRALRSGRALAGWSRVLSHLTRVRRTRGMLLHVLWWRPWGSTSRRSLHVVWRRWPLRSSLSRGWPVHVLRWTVGVWRLTTVLRGRRTLHRHVATLSTLRRPRRTVRMGWSLTGCHMGWALRWPGRRRLVRTVRRRRRGGTLRWWPHRTRSLRRRHRTVDWRRTRHFYLGINFPLNIH